MRNCGGMLNVSSVIVVVRSEFGLTMLVSRGVFVGGRWHRLLVVGQPFVAAGSF